MKIEMGESLLYSWLRHVKECQIVQTNWKISPQWDLKNRDTIDILYQNSDKKFQEAFGYAIYKQVPIKQMLAQAEIDVLGIYLQDEDNRVYAIDVAFHEAGLNYGSKEETVIRVIKKCLRTAMCLLGYLDISHGDIIFASPKIHSAVLNDLEPCIELANQIMGEIGLEFDIRIIANEDFEDKILSPILIASQGIADTSELFLRSYQMYKMFTKSSTKNTLKTDRPQRSTVTAQNVDMLLPVSHASLQEIKIGKIAQTVLRELLEDGLATDEEIKLMQTQQYSKATFDLQYPLLVNATDPFEKVRYYSSPLKINGETYYLCSQWFEVPANNDRPYLLNWIARHQNGQEGQ